MKFSIKYIIIGVLVFNIALLVLTQGLSYQAEMQNPRAGNLVNVDDVEMHVIQSSTANSSQASDSPYDALVLIHGASTSALDFSTNLLPELSKRHHTIAIDRPGHGYSERSSRADMDNPINQAELILDTLSEMQIEKPIFIGHSWAGSVVMAALLADHESVSPAGGVVIAGVTHPYEREDSAPTRMALGGCPRISNLIA
ncbi:alpha/beta fold hydrolase [Granulosicoccus sp.]|nr:alpha/beta fold hydrolase [Granulosicoccus sp.]